MTEAESVEPAEEVDEEVDLSEEEMERVDDDDGGGCKNCDEVGEDDMFVVYDKNFEYPWKAGNPYARVCPECGSRTFCPKSYWESKNASPDGVAYVIEKAEDGEEEIQPQFICPYTEDVVPEDEEACGEMFLGPPPHVDVAGPSECPNCGRELNWSDD